MEAAPALRLLLFLHPSALTPGEAERSEWARRMKEKQHSVDNPLGGHHGVVPVGLCFDQELDRVIIWTEEIKRRRATEMGYQFPPDVDALVREQLASGKYESEDELLLAALQSLGLQDEDWAAVSEAIETLEAGETGMTVDEAVEEVRRRNGIS